MVIVSEKRGKRQKYDVGSDFEKLRSLIAELVVENNSNTTFWAWKIDNGRAEVIGPLNGGRIYVTGVTDEDTEMMRKNIDLISGISV